MGGWVSELVDRGVDKWVISDGRWVRDGVHR